MLEDNITHETPFIPHPNDNLALREVKEITTDTPNKYKKALKTQLDHVVAQWEAKKVKVKLKNVGSGNTRSTSGFKNKQQARPVEKCKRQCEDTWEEDWLQDISMKSKKRAPQILPHMANAHHSPIVQLFPSIKIGPPHGAKRNKTTANNAPSRACIQRSSQAMPEALSLSQSSSAKSAMISPILLHQEEKESSEDDLCSHVSQLSSLPTLAKTSPSSLSSSHLFQKIKEIKELQFGISKTSNVMLKLALENALLSGPLGNMEEIKQLQCEISIASNTALELVLEVM
ncbi:hypothetical protein PAXINDRAFT_151858 [Paxillus involutus ATCC 200175]|nr:hypothetical protein PAXINDRAFT_151858 [Paxillus involutus ATCC 200175]